MVNALQLGTQPLAILPGFQGAAVQRLQVGDAVQDRADAGVISARLQAGSGGNRRVQDGCMAQRGGLRNKYQGSMAGSCGGTFRIGTL